VYLSVRGTAPPSGHSLLVTTDKVYENRESLHAYREGDRLGGVDPYSASKAAAEIVSASYRQQFFQWRVAAAGDSACRVT